jgi:hypothetical protein
MIASMVHEKHVAARDCTRAPKSAQRQCKSPIILLS